MWKHRVIADKEEAGSVQRLINTPNTIEQSEINKAKRLLDTNPVMLYHGNQDAAMIPVFGQGKRNNDYGQGFYTTPDKELGKEWAYSGFTKCECGYLHSYCLDKTGLEILDLTKLDSMHWLAELLQHRRIDLDLDEDADMIVSDRIEQFLAKYKLNTDKYDLIIGYRADDKYFSYADSFVRMELYRESLDKALRLGNLGLQVFFKSEKAFERLHESAHNCEIVDKKYRNFYLKRDQDAREQFLAIRREDRLRNLQKGHTILDVLAENKEVGK